MPPLTNAMSFIDRQQSDLALLNSVKKLLFTKALRRDVKKLKLSFTETTLATFAILATDGGTQMGGGNAQFLGLLHLIFHQRDQGRDHEHQFTARRIFEKLCGELKAKTFPHSGRHQGQSVFAFEDSFEDLLLFSAKALIGKFLTQQFEKVYGRAFGRNEFEIHPQFSL